VTLPIYLDCDTGIDDALALAYLLADPHAEIVGIGTVSGNIDAAQAARNTLDLLALAQREGIPVAVGAGVPQSGIPHSGAPHVHGANGIGNIVLPRSEQAPGDESAAEMLVRLAHRHRGELRVVAIGPLTNLAAALRLDGRIADFVREVTIMGGAALVPGNVSAVAEANIANDPEAAADVFRATWPITLVPLDVTMDHTLHESDRIRMLSSDRPVASRIGEMLDVYFEFYESTFGRRTSALHDPLAAAIACGTVIPTVAPLVSVVVDDTIGPGRGQTICDLRGRFVGYPAESGANCRVVLETDIDLGPHLTERILTL
jgi:purine nucleosidase